MGKNNSPQIFAHDNIFFFTRWCSRHITILTSTVNVTLFVFTFKNGLILYPLLISK